MVLVWQIYCPQVTGVIDIRRPQEFAPSFDWEPLHAWHTAPKGIEIRYHLLHGCVAVCARVYTLCVRVCVCTCVCVCVCVLSIDGMWLTCLCGCYGLASCSMYCGYRLPVGGTGLKEVSTTVSYMISCLLYN